MLQVDERIAIPLREIKFSFSRSSGPGGQNVNKVNSRVQLRWNVEQSSSLPEDVRERFQLKYRRRIAQTGEIVIASQRFRDQGRNVADALNKLRELLLAVSAPPKARKKRKVSKRAKQRRVNDKRKHAQKKELRKSVDG